MILLSLGLLLMNLKKIHGEIFVTILSGHSITLQITIKQEEFTKPEALLYL